MLSKNGVADISGDILDIGCLNGEWTRYLSELTGRRCIGLDVNPEIINVLKRNNPNEQNDYLVGDISSLPFRDGSMGLVFVSGVLQYVPDFEAAISELYRVASSFVLIGRLSSFKHHSDVVVYQDGKHKVWARNYREIIHHIEEKFDIIDRDYSSELWYVDNIPEPVINSHFFLRKKSVAQDMS